MSLRTLGCGEVAPSHYGTTQTFAGWLNNCRAKGNIAFLELRDRTGMVQFVLLRKELDESNPGLFDMLTKLTPESCIAITGVVIATEKAKAGFEVKPTGAELLNPAATPMPMALWDSSIETGLDTRLDNRYLDLRTPRVQAIFAIRNEVLRSGVEYLRSHGFVEVHTSNINGASSEGGTEVYTFDYFGKKAFLAQSPQLYKQMLMASGLDRIFEVGWYFRAEKHKTVRHLNESTAFDLELAWIRDEEDVMKVIEGLLHSIWESVAENCQDAIAILGADVPVPSLPFRRVKYEDALVMINGRRGDRLGKDLVFGDDIGTEAERILYESMKEEGHDFYFITRWPLAAKPFYVHPEGHSQDDRLCRAFDLDYRGVELISGAQRIHDPELLAKGIERWGLNPSEFKSYIDSFRYGMPPHGGCGLGIERILMQMLGLPNIREAILFPRDMDRLAP